MLNDICSVDYYDKLVRDNVIDIIIQNGDVPIYKTATSVEIEGYLRQKLSEEIDEFFNNPAVEEMADILEVLECISTVHGISNCDVDIEKKSKRANKGAFKNMIVLEKVLRKKL